MLPLAALFAEISVLAAPLLNIHSLTGRRRPATTGGGREMAAAAAGSADNFRRCIPKLRAFFELILAPAGGTSSSVPGADADKEGGGSRQQPRRPSSPFEGFSAVEHARFVLCVVLSVRLSFLDEDAPELGGPRTGGDDGAAGAADNGSSPAHPSPRWDAAAARNALRLDDILARFIDDGKEAGSRGRVAAANMTYPVMRAVLAVVRDKYARRAEFEAAAAEAVAERQRLAREKEEEDDASRSPSPSSVARDRAALERSMRGCPMLDGSAEAYLAKAMGGGGGDHVMGEEGVDVDVAWWPDGTVPLPSYLAAAFGAGGGPAWDGRTVYHDLWATMTVGWAGEAAQPAGHGWTGSSS